MNFWYYFAFKKNKTKKIDVVLGLHVGMLLAMLVCSAEVSLFKKRKRMLLA